MPKISQTRMGQYCSKTLFAIMVLCFLGSGCVEQPPLLKAAEPFIVKETPPTTKQGFGKLPTLQYPRCTAKITLTGELPKLPETITVLKIKRGSPNDTELQNIAAAINIPPNVIGKEQIERDLTLSWKDDKDMNWTYLASKRLLTFMNNREASASSTVSSLPENEKILALASTFLQNLNLDLTNFGEARIVPDWQAWRSKAEAEDKCLDARGLEIIKDPKKKLTPFTLNPPDTVSRQKSPCVSFEFPSKQIVRYPKKINDRSIIKKNGYPVYGIELMVDMITGAVSEGRIELPAEIEKSDYPALAKPLFNDLLRQCGLSGASGELILDKFDFEYLLYEDSLLLPVLVGSGMQKQENDSTETYRVVVPLIQR